MLAYNLKVDYSRSRIQKGDCARCTREPVFHSSGVTGVLSDELVVRTCSSGVIEWLEKLLALCNRQKKYSSMQ